MSQYSSQGKDDIIQEESQNLSDEENSSTDIKLNLSDAYMSDNSQDDSSFVTNAR